MGIVEIKVVGPAEWETWRGVRLTALGDAPDAFGATSADWEHATEGRWRERLTSVPLNVVAVVGGLAVGQASGTALEADEVELISMWVSPAVRGDGVADKLVAAVVEHARGQGAARLRLSVRRANPRAIAFYRRLGFVETGPGDEPSEMGMTVTV